MAELVYVVGHAGQPHGQVHLEKQVDGAGKVRPSLQRYPLTDDEAKLPIEELIKLKPYTGGAK